MKKLFYANRNKKGTGGTILLSDNTDYNKKQRRALHNNKKINQTRRYSVLKQIDIYS